MSTVEVRDITKSFGDFAAVNHIDLMAKEGEFLVLLGPSGCGKTTLMRMIAGLEDPTSGDVLIGGSSVKMLPPRARNIAMVFQSYALYPHLTVYRNIAFPLRARRFPRATIDQKVRWAAGMFGMERMLNRKPRQLSGGERQRVALARAVVREPQAFLLDEPLSNLDAKLRILARDELKQFQRRIGTTTIYVTHDQIEAMGLGDRIAILNQGQVRQIGTPQHIYGDPADTFVATFIGSPPMNLAERDGIVLGFRPEDLCAMSTILDVPSMRIPLRITRFEYLGADRLIYGVLEPPFSAGHVIVRLPSSQTIAENPGESAVFAVAESNVKRFDRETGKRLGARPPGS